MKPAIFLFLAVTTFGCTTRRESAPVTPELYHFNPNAATRWTSPENPTGAPGQGGKENDGGKGHAFDGIKAGQSYTLLDVSGTGVVTRMWITVADRSASMLRSLKLEIYWDGESKPAVSVPFGDFFGAGLGRLTAFSNALFVSPEGRSFQSYIPMPFRKGAKIVVTNESSKDLTHIFYDVNYQLEKEWSESNLYFHSYWSRDTATTIGTDFDLLPPVRGRGRYLGTSVGVNADPVYGKSWWGEGEVKIFLDNDTELPTLNGTGTEDYIGTGWGQGSFITPYAGCPVADEERKQWSFYRLHVPDPVYFNSGCRVSLQQIGGSMKDDVIRMQKEGVRLSPVTLDAGGQLYRFFKKGQVARLDTMKLPDGWVNFYRSDDISAITWFYLDRPSNDLPQLQDVSYRTTSLRIE